MLVGQQIGDDADVRPLARTKNWWRADLASSMATEKLSVQYFVNASSFGLRYHPWFRDASVLQLHNLHGGYFAHSALPLLTRGKPTVWYLHDMWAATGHCAYSYECERWRTGCGACPYLSEHPPLRRDLTALNWRVKQSVYRHTDMTLVTPSRWLARIAAESPLLSRFPSRVIPYGIDLDTFHSRPQAGARAALGLPLEGHVVLIAGRGRRKGAALVQETLARTAAGGGRLTALVMGEGEGTPAPQPGVNVVELGHVRERERVADAYLAADVLLHPALADNLPNSILESMASGRPVVAIGHGGVPEIVRHLEDGYLVEHASPSALAIGLRTLLDDDALRERLGRSGAAKVERDFTLEAQARAFLAVYEELVEERQAKTRARAIRGANV